MGEIAEEQSIHDKRESCVMERYSAVGGQQSSNDSQSQFKGYQSLRRISKNSRSNTILTKPSVGNNQFSDRSKSHQFKAMQEEEVVSSDDETSNPVNQALVDCEESSPSPSDESSNDFESSLIESSASSNGVHGISAMNNLSDHHYPAMTDMYKKLNSKNTSNYVQIKAIWVLDHTKSVIVDVSQDETIAFLQTKIGESMEESYDDFRGLRHVEASCIFDPKFVARYLHHDTNASSKNKNPQLQSLNLQDLLRGPELRGKFLNAQLPIKDALKNGDSIFFHIETMDLWVNTDIHLTLMGRMVLQGRAQFKISKGSTFISLRKKLQIFGIKLWCHKNKQPITETTTDDKGSDGGEELKITSLKSLQPLPGSNLIEETKNHSDSFNDLAPYPIEGAFTSIDDLELA